VGTAVPYSVPRGHPGGCCWGGVGRSVPSAYPRTALPNMGQVHDWFRLKEGRTKKTKSAMDHIFFLLPHLLDFFSPHDPRWLFTCFMPHDVGRGCLFLWQASTRWLDFIFFIFYFIFYLSASERPSGIFPPVAVLVLCWAATMDGLWHLIQGTVVGQGQAAVAQEVGLLPPSVLGRTGGKLSVCLFMSGDADVWLSRKSGCGEG